LSQDILSAWFPDGNVGAFVSRPYKVKGKVVPVHNEAPYHEEVSIA